MAQTGYTPISLYHSTTASAVPTAVNLDDGELAINITDEKLYFKNAGGTVKLLADSSAQGTVTSVDVSGGTTGLTTSGGPVTGAGTITLSGTLGVANGGTGATSLTANNVLIGNGGSAVQFVAPGTSGNILTSDGTTWTSSAPAPGGIDYVVKTANYTTQNNEGVLADTSGGAFTVTLPSSPSTGDQVVVADPTGDWGTNNLTVGRNGSTISGAAEDLVCDIAGAAVQLVYDGTTWAIYAQIGGNGGTAVTLDGVQTLTNKTLAATTLSGTLSVADNIVNRPVLEDYAVQGSAIGNVGATRTFDLSTANFFSATVDQASTFTFSNPPASGDFGAFVMELTNGGAYTITWPTSVDWPGGTAVTLTASGVDQLVFTTRDGGTTWYGFVAGLDIKSP